MEYYIDYVGCLLFIYLIYSSSYLKGRLDVHECGPGWVHGPYLIQLATWLKRSGILTLDMTCTTKGDFINYNLVSLFPTYLEMALSPSLILVGSWHPLLMGILKRNSLLV